MGRGVKQDARKALKLILPVAEAGDPYAEFLAGSVYLLDNANVQNYSEAKYWLERSAAQDFGGAYWIMGIMYASGMGYPQDVSKASELIRLGESKYALDGLFQSDLPQIKRFLANASYYGIGTKKDPETAVRLLEQAIDTGDTAAAVQLGEWYVEGKNITQNIDKGLRLLNIAASKDNDYAIYILGNIYEQGKYIKKYINQAVELYQYESDLGLPLAQSNLARVYLEGIGVQKDYKNALKLAYSGVSKDNPEAKMILALMLHKGWGIPQG